MESAWLIETVTADSGSPKFLTLDLHPQDTSGRGFDWTYNDQRATRFGRKVDADNFAKVYLADLETASVEHGWG